MKKTIAMFLVFIFLIYSNQSYAYALGSMDEFNQSALNVIQMTKKMSSENTIKVKPGEVKTLAFSKETSKITSQLSVIDNEINKMKKLMEDNKVSEKELNLFCDLMNKNITDTFHLYPIVNDLNEYVYTKSFSNTTKTKVTSLVNKYHEAFKALKELQNEGDNLRIGIPAAVVCSVIIVGAIIYGIWKYYEKTVCKPIADQDASNQGALDDIDHHQQIHPYNPDNHTPGTREINTIPIYTGK